MKQLFVLIALSVLLTTTGVYAEENKDPIFSARRAAEDLKAATASLKQASKAKDRIKALSQTIRAYEHGLQAMRDGLRRAAIRERALRQEFSARREQLSRLLGVLQTLQKAPAPLLLIHPSGPLGTARSGQVLSDVTPALHNQADDLRKQLEELLVIQALQITALDDLQSGLDGVQAARLSLSEALDLRKNLPKRYVSDPNAVIILAQNSESLTGFAMGLSDLPFDGETIKNPDFQQKKGKLRLPVFGNFLRAFNEADAAGLRRPGIIVSAPPISLVSAPVASTILYRGPFLDYGNVIILEPESGYLIVLAGLGQVYGEVGEILAPGDPLGLLGGADPAVTDFLAQGTQATGATRQETLYIEVRKNNNPLNPEQWFKLTDR